LEQTGAIVVENLDISISESAIRAAPCEPADAVVWEQLEQSAGEETRLSITYLFHDRRDHDRWHRSHA
jgi:hypothetical protein